MDTSQTDHTTAKNRILSIGLAGLIVLSLFAGSIGVGTANSGVSREERTEGTRLTSQDQSLTGEGAAKYTGLSGADVEQLGSVDQSRSIDWARTYPTEQSGSGWTVSRTADGGFILGGSTDADATNSSSEVNTTIIKTTADGTQEWMTTVDTGYIDTINDIIQTRDGGFAGVGIDAFVKYDERGNQVWARDIQPLGHRSIVEAESGDLFIASATCCDNRKSVFTRTDSTGDVIWQRTVSVTESSNSRLGITAARASEGFVVGVSGYNSNNAYLYALSNDGERQWMRRYENSTIDNVQILSNGDILASGSDTDQNSLWLSRVSSTNEERWERTYDASPPITTADTSSGNISVLTNDAILNVDSTGNVLVRREYFSPTNVTVRSAVSTGPNQFVLGGSQETDSSATQFWLAQVTADSEIPENDTPEEGGRLIVDRQDPTAYDSIQAAVDSASTGEKVEVRPGTYREQVIVDKTITLMAPDGATLNGSTFGTDSSGIRVPGENAASPTISGFTMTGYDNDGYLAAGTSGSWTVRNVTVRDVGGSGLDADNAMGDWTVRNLRIVNSSGYAIDVHRTTGDWRATNVRVDNATGGFYASNSSGDWKVTNSTIVDTDIDAVFVQNSSGGWLIDGASLRNNGDDGIDTSFATGNWTVQNSAIQGNEGHGMEVDRTSGSWAVLNSTIKKSSIGIYGSYTSGEWIVRDSVIEDNKYEGLFFGQTTDEWTIADTRIRNNSDGGVATFNSTGNWTIVNSIVVENSGRTLVQNGLVRLTGTGIDASLTTGDWRIKNSTISQNQGGVLATESRGDWVIEKTEIRDNAYLGVASNASTGDWRIESTDIVNHSNSGIYARMSSGDWTVQNSTLRNNGGNVTYVGAESGDQEFVDSDGIDAVGSSGTWRVRNTSFVDNVRAEVSAINATDATVEGDARRNWWGQTGGPTENQCVGNVICANWLLSPGGDPAIIPNLDRTSLQISPFPVSVGNAPTVSVNATGATDVFVNATANGQEGSIRMQNVEDNRWEANLSRLDTPDMDGLERGSKVELSIVACNEGCTSDTKVILNRTDQTFPDSELPTSNEGSRNEYEVERKRPLHYFVFEEVVDVPVILVDFAGENPSDHGFEDRQSVTNWERSREYDINSFLGSDRGAMGSLGVDLIYYDNGREFYKVNSRSDYDRKTIVERVGSIPTGNPDFGKRHALTADGKNAATTDGTNIEREYIVTHPGEPLVKRAGVINGNSTLAEEYLLPGDGERIYVSMNDPHHYGVWIHEISHLKFGLIDLYPNSDEVKGGVYNGVMSVNSEYGTPNNVTNDDASLPSPYSVLSRTKYGSGGIASNNDQNRPWVDTTETNLSVSNNRTATVTIERINRTNIGDTAAIINTGEQGPDGTVKYAFELDSTSTKTEGYRLAERNGNLKRVNEISAGITDGARDYVSNGVFAEFDVEYTQSSGETRADIYTELTSPDSNRKVVSIDGVSFHDFSEILGTQSSYTAPDADLRAVDNQGRVTGVTEDGEFVNEIPGARASGDRVQGPEWISIPSDADVEFEVSTADTQQFVNETNVSTENATISYTTEITEVGENPQLVTENGSVTVTNTTSTTTNQSVEPGETKEVSTGFSVAQFDRAGDGGIGFDDLRFALREFNNGNITFGQLRRILRAYNTEESV